MRKSKKTNVDMPPVPPLFNKAEIIAKINNEIADLKNGNYLVKLLDLRNGRRTWISYEFYYDIMYMVTDLNNPKREFGVCVPGMGGEPIPLNKELKHYKGDFYNDENYYEPFYAQLWRKMSLISKNINEEGYYKNDQEKRKGLQR